MDEQEDAPGSDEHASASAGTPRGPNNDGVEPDNKHVDGGEDGGTRRNTRIYASGEGGVRRGARDRGQNSVAVTPPGAIALASQIVTDMEKEHGEILNPFDTLHLDSDEGSLD